MLLTTAQQLLVPVQADRQTDRWADKQTDSETDTGGHNKRVDIHVCKKIFMLIESNEGAGEKWFEMGSQT